MKKVGSKRSKTPGFNGRAVARPVRSFWPVRKKGQFGHTRPVGGMAGLENEKERVLCQHSRVQPVTALMPTDRNAGHRKWQYLAAMTTRATRLAANYRWAFHQFDILTRTGQTVKIRIIRYRRYWLLLLGGSCQYLQICQLCKSKLLA